MIFKEKPIYYFKVFIVIGLSYFLVNFLSGTMFIANTPTINSDFPNLAKNKFDTFFFQMGNYISGFASISDGSISQSHILGEYNEANITYSQIKQGLQTGEDRMTKKKYIKSDRYFKYKITTVSDEVKTITLYESE
ncbi:MAG: hypothetical protein NTV98_04810 [Candidatus Roizmanbacteria bacterium]|nr:hypothetical protein [Candidatus Roizmanbacteria bacterium]